MFLEGSFVYVIVRYCQVFFKKISLKSLVRGSLHESFSNLEFSSSRTMNRGFGVDEILPEISGKVLKTRRENENELVVYV